MTLSFIYYLTLSKFVDSSFPQCNVYTGVHDGCLAFTSLDGISLCHNYPNYIIVVSILTISFRGYISSLLVFSSVGSNSPPVCIVVFSSFSANSIQDLFVCVL